MRSKGHRTTIWLLHIITLWHVLVFVHMLNASCIGCHFHLKEAEDPGVCWEWKGSRSCPCFRHSGNGWTRSQGPRWLWLLATGDSSPLNLERMYIGPWNRSHPNIWSSSRCCRSLASCCTCCRTCCTSPACAPSSSWSWWSLWWLAVKVYSMCSQCDTWGTVTNGSWRGKQDWSPRLVSGYYWSINIKHRLWRTFLQC